ncbi:MAG TPA: OmpA/MotB family protein [Candidatus Hypogeohydataceae bacterium YC41]
MGKAEFYVKLFLVTVLMGSIVGCAETEELRGLNRRQAITIRDQSDEIDHLKKDLAMYQEKANKEAEEKKRLMDELDKLAKAIGHGAAVRETPEGPVIQLPEIILFDPGMATLKPEGETALRKISEHLKANPNEGLRIDGHTDADPIVRTKGLWETNHHLAAGRSLSVFKYLDSQGVSERRMYIAAYGPNRPVASNATEDGKRKNRRVEFLLISITKTEEAKPAEEGGS